MHQKWQHFQNQTEVLNSPDKSPHRLQVHQHDLLEWHIFTEFGEYYATCLLNGLAY